MATTTFIDGSVLRLSLSQDSGVTFDILLHAQSGSISFSRDTSEIVTKDVGGGTGWAESFGKQKSGTLTCNGLLFYATTTGEINGPDLFDVFAAGTIMQFEWTTGVSGDPVYSGDCRCDSYTENADANTEAGFDASFSIQGAVTKGVIAP